MSCGCDVGGADGVNCDQVSGQCTCVPGTTGIYCDQYVYYIAYLRAALPVSCGSAS